MEQAIRDLRNIASRFRLDGEFVSAQRFGGGHINDTYVVNVDRSGAAARYILQKINQQVFRDPASLMDNIRRVIAHLESKSGPAEQVLALIETGEGNAFLLDDDGEYWRVYSFIGHAQVIDIAASAAQVREAAAMFGRFQARLADLPPPPLVETIPGFHDTPARYRQFREALENDVSGRVAECGAEIAQAFAFEEGAGVIAALSSSGALAQRIVHNDTKLNNVMFNKAGDAAICVIDLDTVMPGTVLSDFGDLVRSATVTAGESETDLTGVRMRMDYFAALVDGYLGAAGGFLTDVEIAHLAIAGRVITVETGLRFLTDYLSGDRYFRIARPPHNLDRCRSQFALAASIDSQLPAMEALVAESAASMRTQSG